MTLRKSAPHAKGRWSALAVVASILLLVGAQAAMATLTSGTTFNGNDGNLIVESSPASTNTDWCNQTQTQLGTGTCPVTALAPSFSGKQDKPSGSGDDSFGQGSKEDTPCPTEVSGSIPPNKSDLTRFYVAHEKVGDNTYLYLAWERTNVLGNANMDFEFNQSKILCPATNEFAGSEVPLRTAGDLLVTYDFGGSGAPVLSLRIWSGSAWGAPKLLNSSNSEGAVNTGTVNDPISVAGGPGPRQLAAGTFGEASINLSAVLPDIFGSNPTSCESFGSAYLKSRSASSFTSEPKDFIAPAQVTISNCGTIKIIKNTQNADGTFDYTSTGGLPSPADGSGNFSLTTVSNTKTATFSNVLGGHTYTVTESGPTNGFTFVSLTCTNSGGATSGTSGQVATIGMTSGGEVDCTYVNHIKLSPSFATQASPTTSIVVGTATTVGDTATFTGGYNPSGSVTFALYSDATCLTAVSGVSGSDNIASSSASYSASWTPTVIGTYYWKVNYAGDSNNNGFGPTCGGTNETLTVIKASPSFATQASPTTSIVVGTATTVGDTATFTGGYNPSGSVTFALYSDATCLTAVSGVSGSDNIASSSASYSASWTPTVIGTYYWKVNYAGDSNNNGFGPTCGGINETLTVIKASPGGTTAPTAQIRDTFTISGGDNPTGTVDFSLWTENTCSVGPAVDTDSGVTLTSGSATSKWMSVTSGTYYWKAVYSGDSLNNGKTVCGEVTVVTLP